MTRRLPWLTALPGALVALPLSLLVAPSAQAAPVELDDDETSAPSEGTPLEAEADAGRETEEPVGAAADDDRTGAEDEDVVDSQWLVGARFRVGILPQFLINFFGVEGGRTVPTPGFAGEFGYSGRDFEILAAVGWQSFNMAPTAFRMPNDPPGEFDIFDSRLGGLSIEVDMAWKFHATKTVDLLFGGGLGVYVVTGDLFRYESYVDPLTGSRLACAGVGVPSVECEAGGIYGRETAWPAYPLVDFRTGARWQIHRHFVGRLDLGLGSTGFLFGLGADYGI